MRKKQVARNLVVDDDVMAGIVREFLEADVHVVTPVHHGDDAVRIMVKQEAGLVILGQVLLGAKLA